MEYQEAPVQLGGCGDRGAENLSRSVSEMQMSEKSNLQFRCGGKSQTDVPQTLTFDNPFASQTSSFPSKDSLSMMKDLRKVGEPSLKAQMVEIKDSSPTPKQLPNEGQGLKRLERKTNGDFDADYDPSKRDDRMQSHKRYTDKQGDVATDTRYSGRADHMTRLVTQERDGKLSQAKVYDGAKRADGLMSEVEWGNGRATRNYSDGKGGVRTEVVRSSHAEQARSDQRRESREGGGRDFDAQRLSKESSPALGEPGGHEKNFDRTKTRREDVREVQKRGERTRPDTRSESHDPASRQQAQREARGERPGQVDVKNGDSLWKIAERLLRNGNQRPNDQDTKRLVDDLVRANQERYPGLKTNPNLIKPGMKLDIPGQQQQRRRVEG